MKRILLLLVAFALPLLAGTMTRTVSYDLTRRNPLQGQ